jgi:cell division protein FtsA
VVINIESTMKSVTQAIEAAEMRSGREFRHVITGIAGAHIEGINSRGVVAVTGKDREITRDDVSRVIDAAKAIVIPMDREVLHVIPQQFIVDDQGGIKDPLDMIGIRLEAEVHIVTGSVTSAQNLLKCVNRAGFRVQDIVLQSIASAKAVLSEDEKELGVLLVDLGGGTTDVLVLLDGAPYHTDVIAIGSSQVTSDLSIMLKTPIETAEKIKRESGCCYLPLVDDGEEVIIPGVGGWPAASIPRKEICKIIQSRMAEVFTMVRDQMVKKDYLKRLRGGVVLTGGGCLLPGTVELAKEIFGIACRVGYPQKLGGLSDMYMVEVLYRRGTRALRLGEVEFDARSRAGARGERIPFRPPEGVDARVFLNKKGETRSFGLYKNKKCRQVLLSKDCKLLGGAMVSRL